MNSPPMINISSFLANFSNMAPSYQSSSHLRGVERALDRYVIPCICLLGCLGNLANILVLTRSRYRQGESVNDSGAQIGLMAISVSDILFCIAMFPRGFVTSTYSLFPSRSFLLYYQTFGTGLVTTLILVSTWITVSMATLRYLGICHPLRARRFIGGGFAKALYAVITVVCALPNIPAFMQYRITDMPPDSDNNTFYLIDIGYMDNTQTRGIAFQWFKIFYGVFIPASLLIFFNCSLVAALKRSYRMRKECFVKETASNKRNRVTLTLITIFSTFIILVFPSELMDFFLDCIKLNATKTEVFMLVRSVANTLQVLNFSCNFFLYCTVNAQFRTTFQHLLSSDCCHHTQDQENTDAFLKNHTRLNSGRTKSTAL